MPEGHTLHRLARDLNRAFAGSVVSASSPQGRFEAQAAQLDGGPFIRAEAFGKHLLMTIGDSLVHVHLGLYGKFAISLAPVEPAWGAVRLRLVSDTAYGDLRGPTACELWAPPQVEILAARLGPDPIRGDAPDRAYARISRSRVPIGALLMDQEVVAGIGNVYRAEILFRARMSPHREGRDVTPERWAALWADLTTLMKSGVRAGRIVTTLPEHRTRRTGRATRADSFYVYKRTGEPCRVCGTPVRTEVVRTRNLYWCPVCQADA